MAVRSDVELGGTDQKFNVAMGRDLQRHFGQRPQFGLLLPILPGLDGVQKMSKSLGNTVGLLEDPLSMYSKLEKVPDAAVEAYLTLLTDLDPATLPADARASVRRRWPWRSPPIAMATEAAAAAQADAAPAGGGMPPAVPARPTRRCRRPPWRG